MNVVFFFVPSLELFLTADGPIACGVQRVIVARMSLASSGSTFGVDGMCADVPYAQRIAAASLASMQVAHLVKRTVCPAFTNAVVTIRTSPF